jgi:ABC-type Fe3+/spermidine/putrescine transport system ATPase subunit
MGTGITIKGLVKRFGDKTIIDHVSFDIAVGELVCLLGPSGCGKTTTLRCIAGLEAPEEGRIEINGQPVFDSEARLTVEPYRRNAGMVFQSYAIWPHLTVFENVAFPLRVRRKSNADVEAKVMRALDMVGLADFRARSAQQLSGGQQQRVAVARAIVHEPDVLLFDEPLSNLDARLRDTTRAEIRRLQRELNVAAVYVTHDQAEALSLADRILVMSGGRIHQAGTPQDIYAAPRDAFVADVVGATNFFDIAVHTIGDATVQGVGPDGTPMRVTGRMAAPGSARAMVRPDRLRIAPDSGERGENCMNGIVRQRLFLGGHYEYAVTVGPTVLRAFSPVEVAEGARVTVSFATSDCIVLETK